MYEKVLWIFKRARNFKMKKNNKVINKRAAGIIGKCKILLYFLKAFENK